MKLRPLKQKWNVSEVIDPRSLKRWYHTHQTHSMCIRVYIHTYTHTYKHTYLDQSCREESLSMLVQHGKPPSLSGSSGNAECRRRRMRRSSAIGSVWAWIKAVTETGNSDFCLCAAGLRVLKGSLFLFSCFFIYFHFLNQVLKNFCSFSNVIKTFVPLEMCPFPPADAEWGWYSWPEPSGSVEMSSSGPSLWAGHKL